MQVGAPEDAIRVTHRSACGEEPLPPNIPGCSLEFSRQGFGKLGRFESRGQVMAVYGCCGVKLCGQGVEQRSWQGKGSIFVPFASPYGKETSLQIYVLDTQAKAFSETQPATVAEAGHESGSTAHFVEKGTNGLAAEYLR